MTLQKLLIANRGEIAIRIALAATELGLPSVAVYSEDDGGSLHRGAADAARRLRGVGPRAYLDMEQLIRVAKEADCDAIHPGYGFLAENAEFARRCAAEGITFVGPSPETLTLLGDKVRARAVAQEYDVPVLPGSRGPVALAQAHAFFGSLEEGGAMVIKAVAGGGGRGMRVVRTREEVDEAFARSQSEANAAFGDAAVYVEELLPCARHIEIQVVGDGQRVMHLGERECTVQRSRQKLVEIAPSPWLSSDVRELIAAAAVRLARAAGFRSLGTFEFLVDEADESRFFFIEANPRLQVEHTVTEEVTGVDLVQTQLSIAGGQTLAEAGLNEPRTVVPHGFAVEARVNMEQIEPDGTVRPTRGVLTRFNPPLGPGIRVDTFGYPGYATIPSFDSLLAKVISHSRAGGFAAAVKRLVRAVDEFTIGGVETNILLLRTILTDPDFLEGRVSTSWLDGKLPEMLANGAARVSEDRATVVAGAAIDKRDPLAALQFYRGGAPTRRPGSSERAELAGPPNTQPVPAPLQGTVAEIHVSEGDVVREGQVLFIMSALKMEHVVRAQGGGVVRQIVVRPNDTVYEGHTLAFVEPMDVGEAIDRVDREVDLEHTPPPLQELFERRKFLLDENRPEAVERRHRKGRRTVRENIDQLMDPGTWVEYGGLTIAGQRGHRPLEELIRKTPADGLVAGIGSVNGDLFDEKRARTMFISYDDTVFAGTQGVRGHEKTDRMLELAKELSLPLIFHAEGAGGRSGDTEMPPNMHPSVRTFERMAQLSGKVPMMGVTAGWCYAGNAAILGLTDIIIATEDALIAMGGPATIEGGGMGAFLPEEVGPISDIAPAGTVDVVVKDHDEAIETTKKCLSYFQGSIDRWESADQRLLRHIIPESRLRSFDIRKLIELLADTGSVLELRPDFGHSMVTAFVRIEGHSFGLTANNNAHIGGAIDSPGSDKVARFWNLCDTWNIPIITLVDTPGMMVGPEVEKTGLVRHCSRLFVTGANLETPRFSVVLRKGYALGSLAMMTGSSRAPVFTVAWPGSEYHGMNVESGVLLAYRERLEAIKDIDERAAEYERLVAEAYERGTALNSASVFGIDDVIDPAETRRWIAEGLKAVPNAEPLRRGRRPFLDTW